MVFLYVLIVILGICIDVYFAYQFSAAAQEKGYGEGRYFWLCLLFGLPGWLLVCALPDTGHDEKIGELTAQLSRLNDELKATRVQQANQPRTEPRELPRTQAPAAPKAVPLSSAPQQPVRPSTPPASKPSQATSAAPLQEGEKLRPLPGSAPGTVVCPKCGEQQREGRSRCWACGVLFE